MSNQLRARSIYRRALIVAAVVVSMLLMVLVRVWLGASSELDLAQRAREAENYDSAVLHYARALEWYVPGHSAMQAARQGLIDVAREAEQLQDLALALDAWRSLRSALYATRSLYTPGAELIVRCDQRIAYLAAQTDESRAYHPELDLAGREERLLGLSERFAEPSPGLSLVAVLGFALWVLAAALFVRRASQPQARVGPLIVRWAPLFVAGYGLWLLALYFA
ncbi:MAG: hypothetical protein P9M14_14970 [Candidatus Alcyoniella australis]|nr:hypothetical protein [Candidatus Alcyoniella australis]